MRQEEKKAFIQEDKTETEKKVHTPQCQQLSATGAGFYSIFGKLQPSFICVAMIVQL